MNCNKYLITITLVDGQNFSVPKGSPERIEASVFAEARLGNESVLRSDSVRLTNSIPEFVTELAWQLDRKSLHQLRVERKAIKLQVFMQTRKRRKLRQRSDDNNSIPSGPDETHQIELIGYTILDLRSAQQNGIPKFRFFPLLNPKFRKPSYNRPEIQLAFTLNCLDEESTQNGTNQSSINSSLQDGDQQEESLDMITSVNECINQNASESFNDTKLYTTCLDATTYPETVIDDEIIDNDIIIRSIDGIYYIYDAKNPHKSSLKDCLERYELTLTIPFSTGLDLLVNERQRGKYHYSTHLFGSTFFTEYFQDLIDVEAKEITMQIQTTHSAALATYFELNSNVDIKFHGLIGDVIAISTIQLNQLCSLDLKCRSIEGVFLLQPTNDEEHSKVNASIGVSVVLEKVDVFGSEYKKVDKSIKPTQTRPQLTKDDLNDFSYQYPHTSHQLTLDETEHDHMDNHAANLNTSYNVLVKDHEGPSDNDHHYRFTIDLKKFSYTPSQRLIPTLRELIIRYSYPFFGYKDTITTDASVPINTTSSIVVSGFCEFNFATSSDSLLTALTELPLNLEILAIDNADRVVATSTIYLAKNLGLSQSIMDQLKDDPVSDSSSVPIYALNGEEIGHLQIYLCLRDLGKPIDRFKGSDEGNQCNANEIHNSFEAVAGSPKSLPETLKLDNFISETKKHIDLWKDDYFEKLADEVRRRDNERLKRFYQRIEAKETRRDQEFRRRMEELDSLEMRFKKSLACVESLEKMLSDGLDHLKTRNTLIDGRLDAIESKISQVTCSVKSNQTGNKINVPAQALPYVNSMKTSPDKVATAVSLTNGHDKFSTRRSSLKGVTNNVGVPVPVRSSSLVRRPSESSAVSKIVRRGPGSMTTMVINSNASVRAKSNPAKLNLSRETQEKLMNLRKEKAELLKRGCKPSDSLIQEINSLIERLAC